jgi:predicted aldo/keto reductase-like oxidoreductase
MNRREFIKQSAVGAMGAGLALSDLGTSGSAGAAAEQKVKRIRKGGMVYRRLGRTELMVSEMALGGSPPPDLPVFRAALERGVNYMDSSTSYGTSERLIGQAVKVRRDQVIISTKFHARRAQTEGKKALIQQAENSLKQLETDYVDLLLSHGVGSSEEYLNEEVQAAFAQLKQEGKIRFTGVSNHFDPANVLPPIIKSGHCDVVLLAFNVFSGTTVKPEDVKAGRVYDHWLEDSGLQQVLDLAQAHDVGLVAMKTMAGGKLQNLEKYQVGETTLPQARLKWVLDHEAIACALSEMLSFAILDENLAVVGQTLTAQERAMLHEYVRAVSADVCRMCGACVAACPHRRPIPDLLRQVAYHDQYGRPAEARRAYRSLLAEPLRAGTEARGAGTEPRPYCTDCRECDRACPHGLPLRAKLRDAYERLA